MRPGGNRHSRGFTMAEVITAFAVVSVASAVMIQLLVSTRTVARSTAESRLAAGIAQGVLERVRLLSPEELDKTGALDVPLPGIASRLGNAKITTTVCAWQRQEGLRHVRLVFEWQSRSGRKREIVREALISDNRAR